MTTSTLLPIAVLGAGAWGTALSIHLACQGQVVRLWGHEPSQMAAMQLNRFNSRYLPAVRLPDHIHCCADLAEAIEGVQDILLAVPSFAFGDVLQALKPLFKAPRRLLWASKGLFGERQQWLHEVVQALLGDVSSAVLSGPSFASEVAQGLPTVVTIASQCQIFAQDLRHRFHSESFRVCTSQDVMGVELGGAMKNVIAIAIGMVDGLGFSANARAALITQGLAEMLQLGLALGGQLETFVGLAGVGDLILTCTNNQSRNHRFGLALAQGSTIQAAKKAVAQVVEGIETSAALFQRAQEHGLELPICTSVYRVLYEQYPPYSVIKALLRLEPQDKKAYSS